MASRIRLGKAVAGKIDLSRIERAADATFSQDGDVLTIVSAATPSFPAAIPLTPHNDTEPTGMFAEIDASVVGAKITFLFATPDMRQIIGPSVTLAPGQANPLRWLVQDIRGARWLLLHTEAEGGQSATIKLGSIKLFAADPEELSDVATVAAGQIGSVDVAAMAAAADAFENPLIALAKPEPIRIDSVSVELLGDRLGFATPFDPTKASRKPLTQWRMEDDDQQIFRYLYREAKPKRHLEFGTWQGAGTVYCLQECDATVWTINLPDGEHKADGQTAYNSSDAGINIGRFYIEAGLSHRVCQIFADTRIWDTRNYPADFFDTVLIDGGHQADVVVSDTLKALEVLRPGGLCLWHDFAPDPDVFGVSSATIGVAQGIRDVWPAIQQAMSDVFYIWPSQILVGVKR